MFLTNLCVYKIENWNLLMNLSASVANDPLSYLFFLNHYGRYVADCFVLKNENLLIATNEVFNALNEHIKQFDLYNDFFASPHSALVYYCENAIPGSFKDPRQENYVFLTDEKNECSKLKPTNLQKEFNEFVKNENLLKNGESVFKFVNKCECFLGQEAWNHLLALKMKNNY